MKQVLDIKQMQHLQELGLKLGETLLYWAREIATEPRAANYYGKWILVKGKGQASVGMTRWEYVPAYTLQDVLELLPGSVNWNRLLITFNGCECIFQYSLYESDPIVAFHDEEMIDAAYAMLCWCIENGHVKTNKENMQ